jgi:hypothetical protein
MAHAHCVLDKEGYRYTLRLCNTYCFSAATMVARTRFTVAFIRTYIACFVVNIDEPRFALIVK